MLVAIGCSLVFLAFTSLPKTMAAGPGGRCVTDAERSPGGSKGVAFTNWLVSKAAGVLERKSSRRGFLIGSAMVGSAVAVAGCAPGTQPGSPYSHITDCAGGLCTDGYTEFCCTINNGVERVPAGHASPAVGGAPTTPASATAPATTSTACRTAAVRTSATGSAPGAPSARCARRLRHARASTATTSATGSATRRSASSVRSRAGSSRASPPYTVAEYACTTARRGRQLHRRAHARARVHAAAPPPAEDVRAVLPSAASVVSSSAGKLTAFGRLSERHHGAPGVRRHELEPRRASRSRSAASGHRRDHAGSNTLRVRQEPNNGGYWWNERRAGRCLDVGVDQPRRQLHLGSGDGGRRQQAVTPSAAVATTRSGSARSRGRASRFRQSLGGGRRLRPVGGERRHRALRLRPRRRQGDLVPALRGWQPRSVDVARRHADLRPHGVRHVRAGRSSSPVAPTTRCRCGTSSAPAGQPGSGSTGYCDVGSRDLQRPGRHVRVRARRRQRHLVQPVRRRSVVDRVGEARLLRRVGPIASSDAAGVSVLFLGADRALRTVPLRQRLVGSEQVIRSAASHRCEAAAERASPLACSSRRAAAGRWPGRPALPRRGRHHVAGRSPQGNVAPDARRPASGRGGRRHRAPRRRPGGGAHPERLGRSPARVDLVTVGPRPRGTAGRW